MPARLTLFSEKEIIENTFNSHFSNNYYKSYNIAPSETLYIITKDTKKIIQKAIFGFKRDFSLKPLVNARIENISENKVFSNSFKNNKCIVLINGFLEFKEELGKKQPFLIHLRNNKVFAVAGIFEEKKDQKYVSILTTTPNQKISQIHNRSPIILQNNNEICQFFENKSPHLHPINEDQIEIIRVNPKINNPKNNSENLLQEYKEKTLFDF